MKKRIWITGASGFVGRYLLNYFAEHEPQTEVIGLDINPPDNQKTAAHVVKVDISDPAAIATLLKKKAPSVVFHLVGLLPPTSVEKMWQVNTGVTQRFALALANHSSSPIRFISTGSAAEYGDPGAASLIREDMRGIPMSAYGESKLAATNLLLGIGASSNLEIVIVRPFNFIGPGLSANLVLGNICKQIRSGISTIRVGPLEPVRDFLDVRDAAEAYALIADMGEQGEIYNLCSGVGHSIQDALDIALSVTSKEIDVEFKKGIPPGVGRAVGCCQKLHLATGWIPRTSLKTSLADMLE